MMSQETLPLFAEPFVRGYVEQEIFYNEETWYGVIRLKVEETSEAIKENDVVVVGNFPVLIRKSCTHFTENGKHTPGLGSNSRLPVMSAKRRKRWLA